MSAHNPSLYFVCFLLIVGLLVWFEFKSPHLTFSTASSQQQNSVIQEAANHKITEFNESSGMYRCLKDIHTGNVRKRIADDFPMIGMTADEKLFLFHKLLKSAFYFEFGCGGSTVLACHSGSPRQQVVSVDSSQKWLEKVANETCMKTPENKTRFQQIHVNIGELKSFGFPKSSEMQAHWHNYSEAIVPYGDQVDLVLVDGRFRVACTLQSLLVTKPGTDILIHDFFVRPIYYDVLRFAEVVDCADSMAALRLRQGADLEELGRELEKYRNTPE